MCAHEYGSYCPQKSHYKPGTTLILDVIFGNFNYLARSDPVSFPFHFFKDILFDFNQLAWPDPNPILDVIFGNFNYLARSDPISLGPTPFLIPWNS